MDITMQQVIEQIDRSYNKAFIIHFVKADGSIRQMVATKRNRMVNRDGRGVAKSNFKYSLNQKNLLLINEVRQFGTRTKTVTGVGTVHELVDPPQARGGSVEVVNTENSRPVNIKIHSIINFNGKKVWA